MLYALHEAAYYASTPWRLKGVPLANLAVPLSGVLALVGGLSVLLGYHARIGAALLIAFLVPATLQMHRFWEENDPGQRMNETINFAKNVALVGAALTMMQISEPWPISVDEARAEEEMFIRLGGRDLRALPV